MCFRTYGLGKTWFDKCLKTPVSDNPSTSNMVNGPKHWSNLNAGKFAIFIGHCESYSLEKLSLGDMQNIRTVSKHIDCR